MIDDKTITMDLLFSAKQAVSAYARACNEAANPELRTVLSQQLQHAQEAQQRIFQFAQTKGYYDPYQSPDRILSQDLQASKRIIEQVNLH